LYAKKRPSMVPFGQTVDVMVMLAGAVRGQLRQNLRRDITHVLADDFRDMPARPAARLVAVLENAPRTLFRGHALRLRLMFQVVSRSSTISNVNVMASILSLSFSMGEIRFAGWAAGRDCRSGEPARKPAAGRIACPTEQSRNLWRPIFQNREGRLPIGRRFTTCPTFLCRLQSLYNMV
jgi:hypothetical protein